MRVEAEFAFPRVFNIFGAAEAVAFALVNTQSDRASVATKRLVHRFSLGRRYDLIGTSLEEKKRRMDLVNLVYRGTLDPQRVIQIVRAEQLEIVVGFKLVGCSFQ